MAIAPPPSSLYVSYVERDSGLVSPPDTTWNPTELFPAPKYLPHVLPDLSAIVINFANGRSPSEIEEEAERNKHILDTGNFQATELLGIYPVWGSVNTLRSQQFLDSAHALGRAFASPTLRVKILTDAPSPISRHPRSPAEQFFNQNTNRGLRFPQVGFIAVMSESAAARVLAEPAPQTKSLTCGSL